MPREVEHGVVGARLITVGVGNQSPRIIWNDQFGDPANETQCAHHRANPVSHRLARRGASEGVARSIMQLCA
jgi:hypothetical protein